MTTYVGLTIVIKIFRRLKSDATRMAGEYTLWVPVVGEK